MMCCPSCGTCALVQGPGTLSLWWFFLNKVRIDESVFLTSKDRQHENEELGVGVDYSRFSELVTDQGTRSVMNMARGVMR